MFYVYLQQWSPLSPVPYTVVEDCHYGGDKLHGDSGMDNPTYVMEEQEGQTVADRRKAIQNDYIPHPGLRKAEVDRNVDSYNGNNGERSGEIQVRSGLCCDLMVK